MSLIIERLKEQKAMENREPDDLTAGSLMDKLYELINSGKVNPNTRMIINNEMWALFMCNNCGKQNEKHYKNTILKFEIREDNELEIFTIKRKR